ncbi:hypothetical protein EV644_103511 [Kribbella orskensis]|uniref:DUF397 domain-containing protein n=1 Tax=Kribbella orskensis TaxID=2512216 RepID=A0ABY2BTD9_9ACTN|nr:hypothetical protein EV642_112151 [Kribbella sp. VKM Ac-2500]TCO27807.1 hypothetical protein EV644_103511 [Kribbella orskensis]
MKVVARSAIRVTGTSAREFLGQSHSSAAKGGDCAKQAEVFE